MSVLSGWCHEEKQCRAWFDIFIVGEIRLVRGVSVQENLGTFRYIRCRFG